MKTKQTSNTARDRIKAKIRRMKRNRNHHTCALVWRGDLLKRAKFIDADVLFEFIMGMDDRAKKTPARKREDRKTKPPRGYRFIGDSEAIGSNDGGVKILDSEEGWREWTGMFPPEMTPEEYRDKGFMHALAFARKIKTPARKAKA